MLRVDLCLCIFKKFIDCDVVKTVFCFYEIGNTMNGYSTKFYNYMDC